MEVSSVANSMQKFIDRLEGLNEENRSHILKIKNVFLISINTSTGKECTEDSWHRKEITDKFVMTDEFMIQRTNEGEPHLYIKFTREQTQDFTIKGREPFYTYSRNMFFFKLEHLNYDDAVEYPVTYTQEYWIHADDIDIINTYKGKCS